MSNINDKIYQFEETDETQMHASQDYLGKDHKDLDDDFAALKSVLGIPTFSGEFKYLKNSFSVLKSLFNH